MRQPRIFQNVNFFCVEISKYIQGSLLLSPMRKFCNNIEKIANNNAFTERKNVPKNQSIIDKYGT